MSQEVIVAIIDDDEIHQFGMRKDLNTLEYPKQLLFFSNGKEAIEFLNKNITDEKSLPDIIFLDINMPIMDGFEFLENYKEIKDRITKGIVIYMVSSSIDELDIQKAHAISEIADYIIKPVEFSQLRSLVNHFKDSLEK